MEQNEALSALRSIDETQARLGKSLDYPLWRHVAVGGLIGLFLMGMAMPSPIRTASFLFTVAAIFWLRRVDRERVGTSISGWKASKFFSIALIAVMVGFVAIERSMVEAGWSAFWTMAIVPLTAGATATLGSIARWQSYRAALSLGSHS